MHSLVAEAASVVAPAAIAAAAADGTAVAIAADAVVTVAVVVSVHSCEKSHHPPRVVAQHHPSLLSDAVG